MIKLHIEYNDNLIAKCLLANISANKFLSEFVINPNAEQMEQVRNDFNRVRLMNQ